MTTTLLAASVPAVADLYRLVYPPQPGSNIIPGTEDPARAFSKAMSTAKLTYGFNGKPAALVENTPAVFSATVKLVDTGDEAPPSTQIQVAYDNEATLRTTCGPKCAFDIDPSAAVRQRFQGGVNQLTWRWTVTPRLVGSHTLILEIQPILYVGPNLSRSDFAKINQVTAIAVQVNPNHVAYNAVDASAKQLQPTLPKNFTVGEAGKVTATLPLGNKGQAVHADIRLSTDTGSVPATVKMVHASTGSTSIEREWEVIPDQAGPVNLAFDVAVDTQSGDIPLSDTVVIRRSAQVTDPPPSLWSRVQAPVLWLTPLLALVATALGVWGGLKRRDSSSPDQQRHAGPADDPQ